MPVEKKRIKTLKKVSWIGIIGNAFLAILKLIIGIVSGSLSVMADGIDSSGDVLMAGISLYIAYLISKPPNIRFPYGYGKAETNATNVISFIIFFAGAQLAITSIKDIYAGPVASQHDSLAIVIIIISILGKLGLAWYHMVTGRKINSNMLIATGRNMQGDVLISLSVLIGLICTHFFNLPIIDSLVGLAVSIWIIVVAVRIFISTNRELMDGNIDKETYEKVFSIIDTIPEVKNPHRVRIRSIGPKKMINIDIELDGDMSLRQAHDLSHCVERQLKAGLEDIFDVAIHIEPYGEMHNEIEIGISKDSF